MAHIEPMDIDIIESDYEDKENSILHSNVLNVSRTPCTEKGYEELDVSELNMKLRYSITPASSPMTRSFTANSKDNKYTEAKNNTVVIGNASLTGSFNSTLTNDESYKSSKGGPLQSLSSDQSGDTNKNVLVPRSLDTDVDNNVTITVSDNIDENFSIPSTSSSIPHTPEATTPTKELPKDGGSPIMRGLRSVLSIFRPSQSPIPPQDLSPQQNTSLSEQHVDNTDDLKRQPVQVSTPLAVHRTNRNSPKRNSPLKDSLVFNDDLEKELQWKDESTILFKEEKIPKHKLLLQQSVASNLESKLLNKTDNHNKTVELMDISYNNSVVNDKTMTDIESKAISNIETSALESDGEFVDCETTQTKVEIEFFNESEDKYFKQNQSLESNITNTAIQDSIYTGNNYSLNATVPIGTLNESYGISKDLCRPVSKEETININKDLIDKDLHEINDNALSISKDRSLCEMILPVSSDVDCDIQEQKAIEAAPEDKQVFHVTIHAGNAPSTSINEINDITNTIGPVKDSENNTSSINNVVTSIQNIVDDKNTLSMHEFQHNVSEDVSDTAVNSLIITNNMISDNNIEYDSKTDEKEEYVVQRPGLDISNATKNTISIKDDNFVTINKEITNSNTCIGELNKPNPLNTIEFLVPSISQNINLEENFTKSLKNENNQTHIIENIQIMDLTKNNSNISNSISSEHNEETSNSMLYNENRYFRMSIDTEIPLLETNKQLHHINEPYQAFQNNINNELCNQGSVDFDKSRVINKLDCIITKQNNNIFDNTYCAAEEKLNDSEEFNESKIKYKNNKSEIVSKDTKREMNSPTEIPLPSHNQTEHDILDRENQCNITFSSNSESQLKVELESYMNNQNTSPKTCAEMLDILQTSHTENTTLTDKMGEVNNQDSKSISTDIADETSKNSKFEIVEKVDDYEMINKCVQSRHNTNVPSEDNITKGLLESQKGVLETLSLKNKADDVHKLVVNDTLSNENYTINLRTDIKEDLEMLPINLALEEELNPFETKNNLQISPLSPILNRKGYDVNFDDIDDPFATKTKIRLSPTPETQQKKLSSPSQDLDTERKSRKKNVPKNRRKSQPVRKPVNATKNTLNATFDCNVKKDIEINFVNLDTNTGSTTEKQETQMSIIGCSENLSSDPLNKTDILDECNIGIGTNNTIINIGDVKKGSEEANLSMNLSEPLSLRDMAKSVFNCPEINDINFRSFSDRQNVELPNTPHTSTESNQETSKGQITTQKIDKAESIQVEIKDKKECTQNIEVESSPISEQNVTREINTEDEDTAEGPFIDTQEFIEHDNVEQLSPDKDMMNFEASYSAIDNENADNGELFIDAEAFEFLLNQNKSNIIADSGKESLFLKFDPLFAKRVSSDGIIAALKKVQNKQSTPKKLTKLHLKQEPNTIPDPGPSKLKTFDDGTEDANIQAMSKPMMVVNPAVNSIVSPKKVATPKINRQSLTFTSPAMAVIDRLLSLSGNNSMVDQNTPIASPIRQHNETDVAITQLREMLAEKDIHVHNLRTESKELKDRLCSLEAQVEALETESAERLKKVNDLSDRLVEKTKMNKSMAIVVEEYERTIASLISEMEQEKKKNAEERMMLIKERDEQTAHLASMEVSFSDLHSKYEKSKQIIYSMKANEDTYRKSIKEFEESLEKMQNNYELLKQHATSKLNHANQELEKFNKAHEAEILKLSALIKRKELHITSLEETLTQKTKANQELTAICDELINKVG